MSAHEGLSGMGYHAQHTEVCIITLRAHPGYANIHQIMYKNIGGSPGMCKHTQYTQLCIITLGARRDAQPYIRRRHNIYQDIGRSLECASLHNTL